MKAEFAEGSQIYIVHAKLPDKFLAERFTSFNRTSGQEITKESGCGEDIPNEVYGWSIRV